MGYTETERSDDVASFRAQVRDLTRYTKLVNRLVADDTVDALYLLEKVEAAEHSAAYAARDLRLIYERSGSDRWVDISTGEVRP